MAFGYNTSGERVWKYYEKKFKDSCSGGGIGQQSMGTQGLIDDGDPPDTLCDFVDSSYIRYSRGQGKVLAEYGKVGSIPKARYIYAGDQRIAMIDGNGEVFFYLNDHLGSARVVFKESDTPLVIEDKYHYLAFGDDEATTTATNQRYRYTGKPHDDENGLNIYYYGARYYDPELGRFMAVDPLANKYPGWSPYVYTLDNPQKYTDPDGRMPQILSGAIIGGIIGGGFELYKQVSSGQELDIQRIGGAAVRGAIQGAVVAATGGASLLVAAAANGAAATVGGAAERTINGDPVLDVGAMTTDGISGIVGGASGSLVSTAATSVGNAVAKSSTAVGVSEATAQVLGKAASKGTSTAARMAGKSAGKAAAGAVGSSSTSERVNIFV